MSQEIKLGVIENINKIKNIENVFKKCMSLTMLWTIQTF